MVDKVHAFLYKKTGLQQSKGGNNILVDVLLVCFEVIVSRERDSYHGEMIAARHDP